MDPPPASNHAVDASRPFRGLVLCCTSIEADLRTEIGQRTADMGGVHKYDLTPEVTHLIVGDYDTPKYRHVAKERPDIKPMAAAWVDAVRQLWMEDQEVDFDALEREWMLKPFESGGGTPNSPDEAERDRQRLVCCLTGFEDNIVRSMIEEKVKANGGIYVADLSKKVTHLIVARPEGKKFLAAQKWNIHCVGIEWLHDSVERGMILLEDSYDALRPPAERGRDAWTRRDPQTAASAKRARDPSNITADQGRRKLRKSASMRMSTQSNNIWGDILNQSAGDVSRSAVVRTADDDAFADTTTESFEPVVITTDTANTTNQSLNYHDQSINAQRGILSGCLFLVHGFSEAQKKIVFEFVISNGGQLTADLEDLGSSCDSEPLRQRYLLVTQASHPDTHPQLPDGAHIITEFFIERCIHGKALFSPQDHVLGQPFPHFPIEGFEKLTISTTGFINEQLNQVEKSVTQLGAVYSEKLNRLISLLVCADLASLKTAKRELAILHNIPIVSAEWLWQCVTTGCLVPWDDYRFEELTSIWESTRAELLNREREKALEATGSQSGAIIPRNLPKAPPKQIQAKQAPPKVNGPAPPSKAGVDTTAFADDTPQIHQEEEDDSIASASARKQRDESQFETAPTHMVTDISDGFASAPLSETTLNSLNKPNSPLKQAQQQPRKLKRFPTNYTVCDSEAGDESEATASRPATAEPENTHESEEAERKRIAQQAREEERQGFVKRLGSLIANDPAAQEGSIFKPKVGGSASTRPSRRKREVFGRAISNVSAASSASAESASSSKQPRRQHSAPESGIGGGKKEDSDLDRFLVESNSGGGQPADETMPPATQIAYDNPEGRRHRQAVEDRILGKKPRKSYCSQERARLSDFDPANAVETGMARRMTRRQGREAGF